MKQTHETVQRQKRVDRVRETDAQAKAPADTKQELKDDLDAVLDEIDSVLEHNAEEFVKQYVQKGGE